MSILIDIDLLQVQPLIKIRKNQRGNEIFDIVRKMACSSTRRMGKTINGVVLV